MVEDVNDFSLLARSYIDENYCLHEATLCSFVEISGTKHKCIKIAGVALVHMSDNVSLPLIPPDSATKNKKEAKLSEKFYTIFHSTCTWNCDSLQQLSSVISKW